jgi:hypothetical protein
MSELPTDTPWDVNWDKKFEEQVDKLKSGGSFDSYRKQIIKIIENPVREGKYKSKNLKGLKTCHVSGSTQDIICFELTPGINDQGQRSSIEELYFHFIDHWDNYDSALCGRDPASRDLKFEIQIPYLAQGFEIERVKSSVYNLVGDVDGCAVTNEDWGDEYLLLEGNIPRSMEEDLNELMPEDAKTEIVDDGLFD